MNKRQIEVQKNSLAEEMRALDRLKEVYRKASKDCDKRIRELSMRTDMESLQSAIWQKRYQEILKRQIDNALKELDSKSYTTIQDYLEQSYKNGFLGTLYDLQGQGVPLILPISEEQVIKAIRTDSKISKGLYEKIGEDTERLKKSIRSELSRGISNGSTWNQIAASIAVGMNNPFTKAYNNSVRIARTEGHRIQNEAAYHCQQKAKESGADVIKQWDATLDGKTRPNHMNLDGQIREVDEVFEVAGKKVMYPGGFGEPSEDCNCRCCLLQRAKWALSEEEYVAKFDGETGKLVKIPAGSYDEFKSEVRKRLMKMQFPDDVYKIKGLTDEVKDELENALLKLKSEYDIKLNAIIVEKASRNDIFITGYHDGVMDMVINEDADFNRIIARMEEQYESGFFAGKSLEDYIAHEMAHVMLYQDCATDNEFRAKYRQTDSLYDALKGISGYADRKKSGNEALAEAFVRVRNKEKVSPITKVLVESYFGRWKK